VTATNITNDPNLTLVYSSNNSIPVDTTKYRYLTYRFQVDGPFDLGLGSVARILWSSESIMTGTNGTATKDILVWPGMNSYTIDLATLSTGPDGGLEPSAGAQLWAGSVKRNLRFDPHEFVEPRTFHLDDVKLTAKPVAAGFFTIRFAGGDADGNPTTVSLYYDNDTNPANGKTLIASGLAMGAGQFGWGTAGVPPAEYYIYAEANDGIQTTGRYSEVPVQVSAGEAGDGPGDFDGDARSDITVFRPSNGTWYTLQSSTNYTTWNVRQWALAGDLPQPGDYDGDGKTDIAVYRPSSGYWYILQSSTGSSTVMVQQWGLAGDGPTPGDYDGDGKTDMAVYRPSSGYWYVIKSSTNYTGVIVQQWGLSGDVPQPGDYDGDGKTDMAVYRPSSGYWYAVRSSTNYTTVIVQQWGLDGDVPQPGDYDGDRKTDMAVYRPSSGYWYIFKSSTSTVFVQQWGLTGDVPTPGDYDGDGRTDIAVYRPSSGQWFLLKSSTNYTSSSIHQWGLSGDVPVVQR
jgi:hypothetical protein